MSPSRFWFTRINVRVSAGSDVGSVPRVPPPAKLRVAHGIDWATGLRTVTFKSYGCGLDAPLKPLTWIVNPPVSSSLVCVYTPSSVVPRWIDASRTARPGSSGTSSNCSGGVIVPSEMGYSARSVTSFELNGLLNGELKGLLNGLLNGAPRNEVAPAP